MDWGCTSISLNNNGQSNYNSYEGHMFIYIYMDMDIKVL